jgi:hypothetical protein
MSLYFVGNTRLPMVAGWDRLLPRGLVGCIRNTKRRSTRFCLWARDVGDRLLSLTGVTRTKRFS